MLVVIAIMVLLAGLIFPLFGQVRTKALRTQSASNLRTIYSAYQTFLMDKNMKLPNAFTAADADLNRAQSSWMHQLIEGDYLGEPDGNSFKSPMSYKVLGSPLQRREAPEATTDLDPPVWRTYGMNLRLSNQPSGQPVKSRSAATLISPARTMLFSEGSRASATSLFNVGVSPLGATPNYTAGIVTFIYADGHIGQLPEDEFPATMGPEDSDTWYFWQGYR
jgi:type II secretory pathway pseudopilin PulG